MPANAGGVDPRINALERIENRVGGAPRVGPQLAQLVTTVAMEEIGRDPEEPGTGVGSRNVVASARVEGDQEGLGGELLGQVTTNPALQVGVNGTEVAIEDGREVGGGRGRGRDGVTVRGMMAH